MTDFSPITRGRPSGYDDTGYNPFAGASFPPGTPVRQDLLRDDVVLPAQASLDSTTHVTGIAAKPGLAPSGTQYQRVPCVCQNQPITLTIDEWADITGNPAGLERGVAYYLDTAVPGKMTTTPPLLSASGTFTAKLGVALSSEMFLVQIGPATPNGGVIE